MTKIATKLKKIYWEMSDDIEAIRASGEVAPDGVNIVSYLVTRNGITYDYYKLVAPEPIFEGKNGKKTKTRNLGDWHSQRYKEAKLSIYRRKAIKMLEREKAQLWRMSEELWQLVEQVKRSRNTKQ